jgi:hypothetical protein
VVLQALQDTRFHAVGRRGSLQGCESLIDCVVVICMLKLHNSSSVVTWP